MRDKTWPKSWAGERQDKQDLTYPCVHIDAKTKMTSVVGIQLIQLFDPIIWSIGYPLRLQVNKGKKTQKPKNIILGVLITGDTKNEDNTQALSRLILGVLFYYVKKKYR